jgi:transcription termination factor NusB
MSNLYSTVQNYSGRQPDNVQNIKQFVTSFGNQAAWIYKRIPAPDGKIFITPADRVNDVLIQTNLYVEGTIYNPSDLNLKKNIKYLLDKSEKTDKLEKTENKILQLNPVEFTFEKDLTNKKHYGLIAQDIEKIYPELVSNNQAGYKSVNYIELIPLMLSQMKIMQEEINELKSQLEGK